MPNYLKEKSAQQLTVTIGHIPLRSSSVQTLIELDCVSFCLAIFSLIQLMSHSEHNFTIVSSANGQYYQHRSTNDLRTVS
jgi:hypothetical protein